GLLQCWVGSETAAIILKAVNAKMSSNSLKEAIKSRDPEKIMIEVLRFMVALYSFHCECFTGETLVSTTEGDKRIDEIEVGDYVYAYDTETEENVPARVTYVSVTETNILVHVYTSEGEEIKTTMLHPFYVKNVKNGEDEEYGIWKASANLVAGDELLTDDGRVVYVEEVKVERLTESIKVYNLEVEGLHTYYVGSGVLVHNQYGKNNISKNNLEKTNGSLSKKSILKKNLLPTTGKIRFVPPKDWTASQPLKKMNGGFIDKFGNIWTKGPSRTIGEAFEWDVQLSKKGKELLGWLSRDNSHLNVSLEGKITHK
ncbi:MAG: hypothetical protein IJA10_09030, partial [Lachnospiraceae bacterium]|nr:hypothetical protein [Lachnospiraceae bacterium]